MTCHCVPYRESRYATWVEPHSWQRVEGYDVWHAYLHADSMFTVCGKHQLHPVVKREVLDEGAKNPRLCHNCIRFLSSRSAWKRMKWERL